jgi:hypothetical protein
MIGGDRPARRARIRPFRSERPSRSNGFGGGHRWTHIMGPEHGIEDRSSHRFDPAPEAGAGR